MDEFVDDAMLALQMFEDRIFNRNPYIPNGRDNLERNLQQELYTNLEISFGTQIIIVFFFGFIEYDKGLPIITVMDWFHTNLIYISFIIACISLYYFIRGNQKQAYIIHILNSVILALLVLVNIIIIISQRLPTYKNVNLLKGTVCVFGFCGYFCYTLRRLYETYQIYYQLKEHQQIFDTIPQLPYKPKGA